MTIRQGSPARERRSLAEEWDEFERHIVPAVAPFVQRVMMRRAFYCGALAIFMLLRTELDGGLDETQGDLDYMDMLEKELKQFAADLDAGRS